MFLFHDFLFQNPKALYLIFFIPLIVGMRWYLYTYRKRKNENFVEEPFKGHLLFLRSTSLYFVKSVLWCVIWFLLCVTLMDPIGNRRYIENENTSTVLQRVTHEVIFLIDASASMRVQDGPQNFSRLESAKKIALSILNELDGQTVSVYAFTSQLTEVVPPTLDYLFVRFTINSLQINEGENSGTNFKQILSDFETSYSLQNPSPLQTFILLSDGGDTLLESSNTNQYLDYEKAIFDQFKQLSFKKADFYIIGIGSPTPSEIPFVTNNNQKVFSKVESNFLQKFALQKNGLFHLVDQLGIKNLTDLILNSMNSKQQEFLQEIEHNKAKMKIENDQIEYDHYFQIPLGLALFLFIFNLILPSVKR